MVLPLDSLLTLTNQISTSPTTALGSVGQTGAVSGLGTLTTPSSNQNSSLLGTPQGGDTFSSSNPLFGNSSLGGSQGALASLNSALTSTVTPALGTNPALAGILSNPFGQNNNAATGLNASNLLNTSTPAAVPVSSAGSNRVLQDPVTGFTFIETPNVIRNTPTASTTPAASAGLANNNLLATLLAALLGTSQPQANNQQPTSLFAGLTGVGQTPTATPTTTADPNSKFSQFLQTLTPEERNILLGNTQGANNTPTAPTPTTTTPPATTAPNTNTTLPGAGKITPTVPPPKTKPAVPVPTTKPPAVKTVTVKAGDTLGEILRKNGFDPTPTKLQEIKSLNAATIKNINVITPGQVIRLS